MWRGSLPKKNNVFLVDQWEGQYTMEHRYYSDAQEASVKHEIFAWLQRAKDAGHLD